MLPRLPALPVLSPRGLCTFSEARSVNGKRHTQNWGPAGVFWDPAPPKVLLLGLNHASCFPPCHAGAPARFNPMRFAPICWVSFICCPIWNLPLRFLLRRPFKSSRRPGLMVYPRLILLYVGVLPHVVRCFLRASAAVNPSRQSHARCCQALQATPAAAAQQPVPRALFIAVLRDVQPERAQEVAYALYRGGFRMMSVTADTPSFASVLRRIAREDLPGLKVGASSVCSEQEVRRDLRLAKRADYRAVLYHRQTPFQLPALQCLVRHM